MLLTLVNSSLLTRERCLLLNWYLFHNVLMSTCRNRNLSKRLLRKGTSKPQKMLRPLKIDSFACLASWLNDDP